MLSLTQVQLVKDNQWLADAPPATCINLGCFSLAPHTDLVIAGPDVGHNVGRAALLASGTIGAAIEGSLSGRKSMAVSFSYYRRFGSWTEAELAAAIEVHQQWWWSWCALWICSAAWCCCWRGWATCEM